MKKDENSPLIGGKSLKQCNIFLGTGFVFENTYSSRQFKCNFKQGQGNQCQTPGFKFEELTGLKRGKIGRNWKKQEEIEKLKKK